MYLRSLFEGGRVSVCLFLLVLSSISIAQDYEDIAPRIVGSGQTAVVVWQRFQDLGYLYPDDAYAMLGRSPDGGASWADAQWLSWRDGVTAYSYYPDLATDGANTWVVTWATSEGAYGNDKKIMISRSTDDGVTWSVPAQIHAAPDTDGRTDWEPRIAYGAGTWIVAWTGYDNTNFERIWFSRSTDSGSTWSAAARLDSVPADTVTGVRLTQPSIATNGGDVWVAAWLYQENLPPFRIQYAYSSDDGLTWSDPVFPTPGFSDPADETDPLVKCHNNVFLLTWTSDTDEHGSCAYENIYRMCSFGGISWTEKRRLNTNANRDQRDDVLCDLTVDNLGNWIAAWMSGNWWSGGAQGVDYDVFVAASSNGGLSWTLPSNLNLAPNLTNGPIDVPCKIYVKPDNSWLAVWEGLYDDSDSGNNPGGATGSGIHVSRGSAMPPFATPVPTPQPTSVSPDRWLLY
ncbi:exo-alpha-sialidase [Candidatus Sumerlaeota bacterium]|nr:exo-alpha-sialidase [Candidatus Sumerlaeota bacterium]